MQMRRSTAVYHPLCLSLPSLPQLPSTFKCLKNSHEASFQDSASRSANSRSHLESLIMSDGIVSLWNIFQNKWSIKLAQTRWHTVSLQLLWPLESSYPGELVCFDWLVIQPWHTETRHTQSRGEYALLTLPLGSPPSVIMLWNYSISLSQHTKTSHLTPPCLACLLCCIVF